MPLPYHASTCIVLPKKCASFMPFISIFAHVHPGRIEVGYFDYLPIERPRVTKNVTLGGHVTYRDKDLLGNSLR